MIFVYQNNIIIKKHDGPPGPQILEAQVLEAHAPGAPGP